jgi:hypothetical protein
VPFPSSMASLLLLMSSLLSTMDLNVSAVLHTIIYTHKCNPPIFLLSPLLVRCVSEYQCTSVSVPPYPRLHGTTDNTKLLYTALSFYLSRTYSDILAEVEGQRKMSQVLGVFGLLISPCYGLLSLSKHKPCSQSMLPGTE